jgi:hypothetical protein
VRPAKEAHAETEEKIMLRILYLAGWLALPAGLLLAGAGSASAQSDEVRQACTGDAMRLCSDFVPDVPKITVCMKRNYRNLSLECRQAMAHQHATYRHHYYRHH